MTLRNRLAGPQYLCATNLTAHQRGLLLDDAALLELDSDVI
ncbi:MAG: hypothetical protein WBE48_08425 [Xanthobacteraceae bacterium]|jgi:hypothetical protein